jgi:uncharacterized membrane protein
MSLKQALAWIGPGVAAPDAVRRPWVLALGRVAPRAVLLGYAPIGIALAFFGASYPNEVKGLIGSALDSSAADLVETKARLLRYVLAAVPVGVLLVLRDLIRERRRLPAPSLAGAGLAAALTGVPALLASMFEYRHPLLTGLIVLALALTGARWVTENVPRNWIDRRPSRRAAWSALVLAYAVFVAWLGFMAHWRFITFHASEYDMSWETNAVHNIVHSGIPRTSIGSGSYYHGELLPANYAALHTPWAYYLYAPFYAVFQDGRTLLWLQVLLMGAGTFGVMLFARRWLRSEPLAAVFGIAYLAFPNVQLYCLHDLHANGLAIPLCLLALGSMEAGHPRKALFLLFLTCIAREETAVYGIATGLFWIGSRGNAVRARYGWVAAVMSLAILLLITKVVMPGAGGTPRYSHFGMFFDTPGVVSLMKTLLFNPWGAINVLLSGSRPEFLWLSLLPFGFLALFGWRVLVFLLIPVGLLLPSWTDSFFAVGINYSAPIVLPVVVMSVAGARSLLLRRATSRALVARHRFALGVFVAMVAAFSSVLYGNVFGKTYKIEFGLLPYRLLNEHNAGAWVGAVEKLPPFGERERLLWSVVNKVPRGVPISTSARINPQLANREVSLNYPYVGQGHPPENRAKYVVLDRLPSLYQSTEALELQVRESGQYRVFFENASGVIFERIE